MNTITLEDRRWSLSGTVLFHLAIVGALFFVKCGNGGGGGGGNNGFGYEGLISLDIAGFGDVENGFGEAYQEATAAEYDQPTVQEEMPAITDDSSPESPSVNNKPNNNTPSKPKDPNTKPLPKEKPKEVTSNLNNALGGLTKPSGSGNTTGNGQQGNQTGQIGKGGALGGGGSAGTGGGQGGGNGTGTGPGDGPGSGVGSGGFSPYNGPKRTTNSKPSDVATDDGTIMVDICIDRNGSVMWNTA